MGRKPPRGPAHEAAETAQASEAAQGAAPVSMTARDGGGDPLAILGAILDPSGAETPELPSGLGLYYLVALAGQHLVSPALWPGLVARGLEGSFEPDLRDYLDALHALNAQRNRRLVSQARELAEALNACAIEPIFLKGTAQLLLGLYPDPGLRLIGDMDVLVDADRLDVAAAALRSVGYR
jgi:hypothetical protein